MPDDLRLRTVRALGYYVGYPLVDDDPKRYNLWFDPPWRSSCLKEWRGEYVTEEEAWAHTPDYGTTWASCEEIDAACKERGWRAQIDMDGDETRVFLFTTINGLIGTRLSAAYAPTFPAAFAEAFCEAVETNGE